MCKPTPRELDIIRLVAKGYKNPDIAEELVIAEQTVKNHLFHIFAKFGVRNRLELALYAVQADLHAA